MFVTTSYQHFHYSSLHLILSTKLQRIRVRFATPVLKVNPKQAASSVQGLVPCIFGALFLVWYAITRLFFGGCFQAYDPVVIGKELPLSLSLVLGTLYICLGCFPLDERHLSAAVGLLVTHVVKRPSELVRAR